VGQDNIAVMLPLIAIGVAFVIGGIAQTDWRHKYLVYGMIGGGGLLCVVAVLFPWLRDSTPWIAETVASVTTNLAIWFCAVILLLAADIALRRREAASIVPETIEGLRAAIAASGALQLETTRSLNAMIGSVEDRVDKLHDQIKALSEKTESQYVSTGHGQLRIATALKARNSLEILRPADSEAVTLAQRLVAPDSDYANRADWLRDYKRWANVIGTIDHVLDSWMPGHQRFLDVRHSEFERVRDMPPAHIGAEVTTQFKTVCIVNERYEAKRSEVMNYFAIKVADI
jgi:uncharacterized coiled-coil protein SlyX